MPPSLSPSSAQASVATGGLSGLAKKQVEIVVMPEKYQGVALNMKAPEEAPPPAPKPPVPPPKVMTPPPVAALPASSPWPMILAVAGAVIAVAGVFTYLNRDLLFKKAPLPKPVVVLPAAPSNLSVTSSNGASAALSWIDAATNETGYRIERRDDGGAYFALTNVPGNSTAFLDVSLTPGHSYAYRVVALNSAGESAPSNDATIAIEPPPPPPPPAATLPPGGLDSDSDGLTDIEEALYGTDAHNPDSDGDGFLDGNEVFHLYNSNGKAPVRLLDAGLVKVFASPAGWSLYVPTPWPAALGTADGASARISTGRAESFAVSVEDNPQRSSLLDWYLSKNPGVVSSAVRSFTTKGGLEGILGADRLDAYFAWGEKVLVLKYDLNGQPFVNFRTTFEMMLNSLKLAGAPILSQPKEEPFEGPGAIVGVPSGAESSATSSASSTP